MMLYDTYWGLFPLHTFSLLHTTALSALVGVVMLLVWRLWKFSVVPALYPNDPKEFPYWMPFLGHALGFLRDPHEVLDRGRQHFSNSREPFAVTLGGKTVYVLTSPSDVQDFFKNSSSLSWIIFVQNIYRWVGITPASIVNMWQAPTEQKKKLYPKRKLPPNQMIEEYHSQQLLPGGRLDQIGTIFVERLSDRVRWPSHNFSCNHSYVLEASSESVTLDVLGWTTHTIIHALTELYYGKLMLEIAPDLIKPFHKWEQTKWKFLFQLPRFMSEDMYAAKGQLNDYFLAYFNQPEEQRDDANHFVKSVETELRACGLDNEEIAKINMLHHWAINGNVHKVTFWIFAHLVHNPTLLDIIRQETKPGIINDVPCEEYLTEKCPRLESIFYEVLRLYTGSTLMRQVLSPTIIGGKTLRAGNRVMAPYRQLHYNEDIWGANAAKFDPDRFLRDKSLSRSPSFRPFGGGVNLCPGRYLAKKVVATFIALTLSRFEVSLDRQRGVQAFPREYFGDIGTMSPVDEDRLILRLTPLRK